MRPLDRIGTERDDLASLVGDIKRLETVFAGWDQEQRDVVAAYRRAIEDLHGEACRRLVKALKSDPAALAALKRAVADEVVYAVLRRHDIVKPSLDERVEAALESVRPMLASHGGDVELVRLMPPAVELRFIGACDGCPASALTFHAGVKKAVEDACPEITEILQSKAAGGASSAREIVSPFAVDGWRPLCSLDDIPQHGISAITAAGESIILSRRGTVVSCFQNACAHLGMAIDGGDVASGVLTCPHHGFRYDLGSGACLTAPEVRLKPRTVRVAGDRVEIRLSP